MKKGSRCHHNQEFEQEAIALVVEHGYSCTAAGGSLGVSGALIGRWKNELEAHKAEVFPGKGKPKAEQQRIHELEAGNRPLPMEREILKKTTLSSMDQCNTIHTTFDMEGVESGTIRSTRPVGFAKSRGEATVENWTIVERYRSDSGQTRRINPPPCLLSQRDPPGPSTTFSVALTMTEREENSRGIAANKSIRQIAALIRRLPSSVCRELAGHG